MLRHVAWVLTLHLLATLAVGAAPIHGTATSGPPPKGIPAPGSTQQTSRAALRHPSPQRDTVTSTALAGLRRLLDDGAYAAAESSGRALMSRLGKDPVDSLQTADAMELVAEAMWRKGDRHRPEFLRLARAAARIRETSPASKPSDLARALRLVALGDARAGREAEARATLVRALRIQESERGIEHPDCARTQAALAEVILLMGEFARAESLATRAHSVMEHALGPRHPESAEVLVMVARCRSALGDRKAAKDLSERGLGVLEAARGANHLDVARTLTVLAGLVANLTLDYPASVRLMERALSIHERELGPDHPWVAQDMALLARYRAWTGERVGARELAERAVAIAEASLGPDDPQLSPMLGAFADLAYPDTAAIRTYHRQVAIQERAHGPVDRRVSAALYTLGLRLRGLGRLAEARSSLLRAVAIDEQVFGPHDREVALDLQALGGVMLAMGDVAAAEPTLSRALTIFERAPGPDSLDFASALRDLTPLHAARGSHLEVLQIRRRVLAIEERAYGPHDARVARDLQDVGGAMTDLGDFAGALVFFERSLAIWERYPETSRGGERGGAMTGAAWCYAMLGDVANAHRLRARVVDEYRRAFGEESPALAWPMANLAQYAEMAHESARAESLMHRALALLEAARVQGPQGVGVMLDWMAQFYARRGRSDEARQFAERAIAVLDTTRGALSSLVGALNRRADLLERSGRMAEGRADRERALRMARLDTVTAPAYVPTAWALMGMAWHHLWSGADSMAYACAEEALREVQRVLPPGHPGTIGVLASVARNRLAQGDTARALEAALQVEDLSRRRLMRSVSSLSEREALEAASTRASGLDVALSVAASSSSSDVVRRLWQAVIPARALVLDQIVARQRRLFETLRRARAYAAATEELAQLAVRGAGSAPAESHRSRLLEAQAHKEQAERDLAMASPASDTSGGSGADDLRAVASALRYGSALIGYVRYGRVAYRPLAAGAVQSPETRAQTEDSYLAFVMRSGDDRPSLVSLGTARELDSLVMRWKDRVAGAPGAANTRTGEALARSAGEALRRRIWDPILPSLGAAEQVFVVPDAALHLVSLGSLPGPGESYLIETRPIIHYLSAEKDLVALQRTVELGDGILALGGPDFNRARSSGAGRNRPSAEAEEVGPAGLRLAMRAALAECPGFQELQWKPLPGATEECRNIMHLWTARQDLAGQVPASTPSSAERRERSTTSRRADLLVGPLASESAFKAMAPGRRILHLATHGYFMGGKCGSDRGSGPNPESSPPVVAAPAGAAPPPAPVESPLLLSGLALAGANRRASAGPEEEDGILTAEEISALDLSGVEWAVLSACETGLGEIRAGEGVLGMRRAFLAAGARTVIMSLWGVSDEATREWMTALYTARIQQGLSTADAVREASRSVLQERRARRLTTHPFFWGAFVSAGDWR